MRTDKFSTDKNREVKQFMTILTHRGPFHDGGHNFAVSGVGGSANNF